jgi:diaminopimelate decarboxylase
VSGTTFDEEKFNMEVRKFLKKVGVSSQRELERAVRDGLEKGRISGNESLKARMTLEIAELGVNFNIEGDIALS